MNSIQKVNLEILHRVQDAPVSYLSTAIILLLGLIVYYFQQARNDGIPVYGNEDIKVAKQRFMGDAMNLITEGYKKVVLHPSAYPRLTLTLFAVFKPRVPNLDNRRISSHPATKIRGRVKNVAKRYF